MGKMELVKAKTETYKYFSKELIALYKEAFSTPETFHFNNDNELMGYLDSIFDAGYGIFQVSHDRLAGVLLATPLSYLENIPGKIESDFDVSQSVYIAEMMVAKEHQGKGIGKSMMHYFLNTIDTGTYKHIFIRVWVENEKALSFYKSVGFESAASELVRVSEGNDTKELDKIYLYQKVNDL